MDSHGRFELAAEHGDEPQQQLESLASGTGGEEAALERLVALERGGDGEAERDCLFGKLGLLRIGIVEHRPDVERAFDFRLRR